MRLKIVPLLTVLLMIVSTIGCGNNTNDHIASTPEKPDTTKLPPVETISPNSDYKPAFPGQTRVAGMKTTTAYKVEKIAENLAAPFALVTMPDGRLMVTLKDGYMEIHDADGKLVKKITGFPAVVREGGGLLDMTFDPDFGSNKMIYWSYSENYGDGSLTAVAKGKLNEDAAKVDNASVIFRATPATDAESQYGSRMVFDKEGNLFVSLGERVTPQNTMQAPQQLNSYLGKIVKITKDGKPAAGDPFLNQSGALPAIYTYGHRNPQGLDINPATGELWDSEFGPKGGDEINLIQPGKNYGWPVVTYGREYSGKKVGEGIQQKEGMEQPVYYWDPVISPSGICFYRGDAIPEWKNNLFVAALSGQHVDRLEIKNNKVTGEERLLADKNTRFRDVTYLDNKLYALTDGGDIYRISKQ